MAIFILALSIFLLLLAILTSLRLVRRTGRGLPWVLLSMALALMAVRRFTALAAALADPGRPPDLAQELIALAIAVIVLVAVHALGRVIDEVRQSDSSRRATEDAYRTLVANLPMVATVMDREGRLQVLNPAQLEAISGYAPQEVAEPAAWRAVVSMDLPAVEDAVSRGLAGETTHLALRFRHKDGSMKWAGSIFYPRREGERITGVNTLTSDITERRTLEEQLRHAQKMEALGAMAGGIAHDFNNLLSSILGNVELAARRLAPDHAARKNLDDAARTALRASEHARQFLSFSRRSVLNPQLVPPNEVCREAVALVTPTVDPRIEFAVHTDTGLWDVTGDPGELVQILVNLLLNARDALAGGGRVTVETSNVTLDETYSRVHAEGRRGEFVRIVVADDGRGMPPEVRARIFEPFFTTKAPGHGTGLGLAMVYATVRRHRGWIHCYSEVGRGTRFSVYLPRGVPGDVVRESDAGLDAEVPKGHETVLLVDDDDDLRLVGVESLKDLGYSVLAARDGLEALDVFRSERERIRLVILDLSMPRLDGRDTLARLREMEPGVRVLITSGHAMDDEAQLLLAAGAVGFVEKPYRLADIGRAVRSVLDDLADTPASRAS